MDESERHPIDELAESFLARYRRGERPSLEDFIAEHPEHEADFRELFPAILAMEELAPGAADTMPFSAHQQPERLGDYRIIREIGRGGMGIVYEAEQESLGRHVALKLLPSIAAEKLTALKRFTREAKAAGKLHHSNIVPVYDVGQCDGLHYYSMQLIEGQSLAEVIRELKRLKATGTVAVTTPQTAASEAGDAGEAADVATALVNRKARLESSNAAEDSTPRSTDDTTTVTESTSSSDSDLSGSRYGHARYWRNVARVGVQLADALQCAHDQGIVHRDMKPSNILLDAFGTAWLTDFGLAQTEEQDLTGSGTVVGTLRYMAPEQLRGWADPRTDVYSLGLTLYELLTLQRAFLSEDRTELLKQICDREPAWPRQVDRSIPRDLETIVLRAIDKEASRRYQSAAALCEDLTRFIELKPIRARRTSSIGHVSRWCQRNPHSAVLAGSVMLLLILIALGASTAAVWLARQAKDLRRQSRELVAEKEETLAQLFRATMNEARAARNSPGIGRRLNTLAAVRRVALLLPEVHHSHQDVIELRNMAAAALTFADLKVEKVIDTGPVARVELDGDLSLTAVGERNGDVTVRRVADNAELVCLEGFGKPASIFYFSDDGRFLAVAYADVSERSAVVRVWDWRQKQVVIETEGYVHGIHFAPDGQLIAVPQLKETVEIYDLLTGEQRFVLQTQGDPPFPQFQPRHNVLAVASRQSSSVQCFDTETGQLRDDIRLPLAPDGIVWSPDGRFLAYAAGASSEVAVWDVDAQRSVGTLIGHRSAAWPRQFTPASDFLVTTGWDDRVIFWETSSGRPLVEVPGKAIRFSRDGCCLAVHEKGKRSVIYRVFVPEAFHHIQCSERLRDVAVASSGGLVAVAGDNGVWLLDGRLNTVLQHDASGESHAVAFHPQDGSLVATSPRGVLHWQVLPSTATSRPQLGPSRLIAPSDVAAGFQRLTFNRSGDRLAYRATDGQVRVVSWQEPTHSLSFDIEPNLLELENIAISPDSRWVAAVTAGHSHVRVWETGSGALVHQCDQWGGYGSVLFSPDSQRLVVRYRTEYVVLETGTWRELQRIEREPTTCWAMAFTPTGSIVALSLSNQLIRLYDTENFEPLLTLEAPLALDYTSCRFSPDGRRLYATSESGTVSCWDLGLIREQLEDLGVAW